MSGTAGPEVFAVLNENAATLTTSEGSEECSATTHADLEVEVMRMLLDEAERAGRPVHIRIEGGEVPAEFLLAPDGAVTAAPQEPVVDVPALPDADVVNPWLAAGQAVHRRLAEGADGAATGS
ncbi:MULTISPECIES: hypothetical protein [Pimelobacter]|uniref:hypothetical protein n=1 Tax=Pimelobacter TaxID=2044 RepID=UPI001C04425F|nr:MULTISPECIES: hypothetical protein [Pimelobacter]MBU2698839.1 hypothetical protein [Pimelobacter sp. 30-1]UUW93029.1 hypothetical protein M0M43_30515 [Pimelobacter simplex]UUW99062.1 hypothetical protein M0M48_30535 [Pimelobacter simplex]